MSLQGLVTAVGMATLALLTVASPLMGQISVIAHPDVAASVTVNEVSEIFGGTVRAWPSGAKIYVADQSESEVGRAFYGAVLKRPTSVVRMHWIQLILSGQAVAPRRMNNDIAVMDFVRRTPGAVGYVRAASLDVTVKQLLRIDGVVLKP
jgi:ABC-type phosphate transport system substrate-binding protein